MSLFKTFPELCDVVSLVIYCNADNTMLLTVDNNNEHWIPSVRVPAGQSWDRAISKELQEILSISIPDRILRLSKTWIPNHSQPFLLHCIYQSVVNATVKGQAKNTMGKYRGKIRWANDADMSKLHTSNSLKSPELLELFNLVRSKSINDCFPKPDDFSLRENFSEACIDILVAGKGGQYFQLVETSGIDKLAQESLLVEFLLACFPANYMDYRAFAKFVVDVGWPKDLTINLFRAADLNNRYGISFREFLYILAAIDPNTSHGGIAAEIRSKYMFTFYDRDKDSRLKMEDFKNIIADIRKSKKMPIDPASVAKEALDTFKAMGLSETSALSLQDFLKAVCDLKIKGTSGIFRSSVGLIKYLKEQSNTRGGGRAADTTSMMNKPTNDGNAARGKMTATSAMRKIDYEVAVHTVKIQRSGQAIDIDEMRQLQEAVSLTTLKQPVNEQARRISIDIFSQRSVSNELLKGLRYLTSINRITDPKSSFTWGQLDPGTYGRNLITVCNQVKEVFRREPRLLELSSPMYILGDFHGNVADLLYFEKTLWHIGPGLSPCSLLFLGDYVDRGPYSIEVISYLLSYKLQQPKKVNLIRGNHEIREVQKMFTFLKECVLKLGDKLGNEVWTAVNNAFDTMPLAAVIDGKLFCCHGGIPPPWLCPAIGAINDIPVPLNQPDSQSSLAWELMWNDPVRPKTVNDKVAMELLANEGFAVNSRRGTAHIFNVDALERFLKTNQLTHIVRAHEVAQAGFQVQQKGKLLTVFSSSKYCGGKNDAACVMADQGKLRILRLETD